MTALIEYDEALMSEVMETSGAATESEAVALALERYKQIEAQKALLSLRGTVEFYPDYDPKEMGRNFHLQQWNDQ